MSLLPTFSPAGWVKNPTEQVDYMLSYFFLTQRSQTHFHSNVVTSYQYLIASAMSMGELKTSLEMRLGDLMKSQFTNVQIEVSITGAFNDKDNSALVIMISCNFEADDGKRYSLSHEIEANGTNVKRINRYNETGQLT